MEEKTFSPEKDITKLKEIVIPDGVTVIARHTFNNCFSLKKITIPTSVVSIGDSAFNGCSNLEEILIPDSVTSIGDLVFFDCKSLKKITISSSVTRIKYSAFKNCKSLKEIVIPDGVTSIEDSAFEGCESLKEITIRDGVSYILYSAFADCKSLKEIIIPNSVISIGDLVFFDCKSLKKITISSSVTRIKYSAFKNCKSLKEIVIPDGVTSIEDSAFEGCESLKEITIPSKVTNIKNSSFNSCLSLEKITIPSSVTSIGCSVFADCKSLKEIIIPNSVISIGGFVFSNCSNLEKIIIPSSVTSIGDSAFLGCTSLKEITISSSVTSILDYAFAGCESLKEITIPSSVTSIGDAAFSHCLNLEKITIPSNVTSIGDSAFLNCTSLKEITILNRLTSIRERSFKGCINLNKITILSDSFKEYMVFNEMNFNWIYINKENNKVVLTKETDEDLEKNSYKVPCNITNLEKFLNKNFRYNYTQLKELKEKEKIKFIPPDYTLKVFPYTEIKNYFLNKNCKRWGKLVKQLGFSTLIENEKINSLTDLMKIYYAIGGFSQNQGESEKAYDYIIKYVANPKIKGETPSDIGQEIHTRFSKLNLSEYNPMFAKFFMKYYKDNPNFMVFEFVNDKDEDDEYFEDEINERDYLCSAYNNFDFILKNYPNMTVNGNERRSVLTPRFVAEHTSICDYDKVETGNEVLANLIGRYGYSQKDFELIQNVYKIAKEIKSDFAIKANKSNEKDGIQFRILQKDDPLGFILGDITNCCQSISNVGESCVIDGYTNPNAGFLIFEKNVLDEEGRPTEEKRILGQAYIWYDPVTKTVCYDNIEIPTKVIKEMRSNSKNTISSKELIQAVKDSAIAIMEAMNENELKVERVTTGEGYNDLRKELKENFGNPESNPKAKNRNYDGYSDADYYQFIIKKYDQITRKHANKIKKDIKQIDNNITSILNLNNSQELI